MNNIQSTQKIILCGFGTVGQGLLQIIQSQVIKQVEVIAIVDRSYQAKKNLLQNIYATDNFHDLTISSTNNQKSYLEQADLVVELIGGIDTPLYIIRTSLENKTPVVTANKALLAEHGYALFHKSKKYKTPIYYEAAITGAIPIVENLQMYFKHDNISQISGILNGTSNFILSKMSQTLKPFEDVLQEAQEKGLAESDPTLDIQGIDASQKLALLGQLVSKQWIEYHKISCKGITEVNIVDLLCAKKFNLKCKLIASLEYSTEQKGLFLTVEPTFVPKDHLLYNVELENNAIFIKTEISGEHLFVGKGAGSLPTAYAIYFNICKHSQNVPIEKTAHEYATILDNYSLQRVFYIRLNVHDQKGVLSNLTDLFSQHQISLAKVRQEDIGKENNNSSENTDIICITHKTTYKCLHSFLQHIQEKSSFLIQKPIYYPILS